ncbi:MAG: hypothetical protein M3331_06130 [Actinomycetota bacterium]|nr:hypothetical protein [Actinomycetota bacterium]
MLQRLTPAVVALLLVVPGCGGDGGEETSTFEDDDFPFTFEYPSEWEETGGVTIDQELGAQPDETLAIALDEDDTILVQRFTLALEVSEDNLNMAKEEFDSLIQQLDPNSETEETEVAGYPALTTDAIPLTTPEDGESVITILFDGDQEYLINCQSTPEEREAVEAACDMVVESIEPTG